MPRKEKIYGAEELARFFAVSEKTIWEWCKKGRLPGFKIGKEWRVRAVDLQKMINQKISAKKNTEGRLF